MADIATLHSANELISNNRKTTRRDAVPGGLLALSE